MTDFLPAHRLMNPTFASAQSITSSADQALALSYGGGPPKKNSTASVVPGWPRRFLAFALRKASRPPSGSCTSRTTGSRPGRALASSGRVRPSICRRSADWSCLRGLNRMTWMFMRRGIPTSKREARQRGEPTSRESAGWVVRSGCFSEAMYLPELDQRLLTLRVMIPAAEPPNSS